MVVSEHNVSQIVRSIQYRFHGGGAAKAGSGGASEFGYESIRVHLHNDLYRNVVFATILTSETLSGKVYMVVASGRQQNSAFFPSSSSSAAATHQKRENIVVFQNQWR